jgi:formylglycine-generating enzyme required for sulfatase activity
MSRKLFSNHRWIGPLVIVLVLVAGCGPASRPIPVAPVQDTRIRPADGMTMVHVPGGEFRMGRTWSLQDRVHTVELDAFWIDQTEVTNGQYVQFLNVLGAHTGACGGRDCVETQVEDRYSHILLRSQDGRYVVERGFENHPITQVSWYGAQAYCTWAGGRLPTEAEWEKAARGTDGRAYPWGNESPDCDKAQYGDCGEATIPVGSRPAGISPYGVLDMAGNVWERVADWYDPAYYGSSQAQNPQGPDSEVRKVFRGGSWGYPPAFLRTTDRARNRPTYAGFNVGFRCAQTYDE